MPAPLPSFERRGDLLVPRPSTRSGWSPDVLNGRYLSGLVAWGAQRHSAPDLQPARLTVDMFRPGTMGPLRVETHVVRDGRRIRVVDSSVLVDGLEICRGTTVFLRRAPEPRGETWGTPEWAVPDPEDVAPVVRIQPDGAPWASAWETRYVTGWGELTERRQVWVRETRAFVDDEVLTPFLRTALAADMGNGQLNASPIGLAYINADLTLTLARLPRGEWVGMDARSRAASAGVAVGTLDMYDGAGRIGHVTMIAVADERNLAPSDPASLAGPTAMNAP